MTADIPVLDAATALDRLRGRRSQDNPGLAAMYHSYLGGIVTDPALMAVPLDDHMLHRGHGVFDTASLRDGRIYRLAIHLERLLDSAAMARIDHDFSGEQLTEIVAKTVAASGLRDGSIRYWLSAGPGSFGFDPAECIEACFYCAVFEGFSPRTGATGHAEATIRDTPMKPTLLATIKSNNYLLNVLTHLEAKDQGGWFGVLVDDDGYVAEGAVVNVCFVTSGSRVLLTPPFEGILRGTTARRVLRLAEEVLVPEGLIASVEQRPVLADELRGSIDEMFMVGGDTHLYPVTSWDGVPVGDGAPGRVGARTLELLETEASSLLDPALADTAEQYTEIPYT